MEARRGRGFGSVVSSLSFKSTCPGPLCRPPGGAGDTPSRYSWTISDQCCGAGPTGLESAACCSSATYWLYEEVQNAMLDSAWLKTSFRKQTQRAHTHTHMHTHMNTHMHTHTHLHTGTPNQRPSGPRWPSAAAVGSPVVTGTDAFNFSAQGWMRLEGEKGEKGKKVHDGNQRS